jgi:hypothetical protein
MRQLALLFTVVLLAAPLAAGQSASSTEKATPSTPANEKAGSKSTGQKPADPAVSLDKIREGLNQPAGQPLKGLSELTAQEAAHFKVQVEERRKIEELLATLDFKSGPTPAGGIYASELQRIQHPPLDQPLMQPYAAFNTSELLTIAIENLAGRYLAGRAMTAVSAAERAHAEAAAREDVARAMAGFCSAQPDLGAGLQACAVGSPSH